MLLRRVARALVAIPFIYDGLATLFRPEGTADAARLPLHKTTHRLGLAEPTEQQLHWCVRAHGAATAALGVAMAANVAPRLAATGLAGLTAPLVCVHHPSIHRGQEELSEHWDDDDGFEDAHVSEEPRGGAAHLGGGAPDAPASDPDPAAAAAEEAEALAIGLAIEEAVLDNADVEHLEVCEEPEVCDHPAHETHWAQFEAWEHAHWHRAAQIREFVSVLGRLGAALLVVLDLDGKPSMAWRVETARKFRHVEAREKAAAKAPAVAVAATVAKPKIAKKHCHKSQGQAAARVAVGGKL